MALSWEVDREIYQIFIQETLQLLEQIEEILVGFDRDWNQTKIEELVRAAHTIKGGAAQIEFSETQIIAARLEVFFRRLNHESVKVDLDLLNLLIEGYELLRLSVITRIENNGHLDNSEDLIFRSESIFTQLEAILEDNSAAEDRNIPKITDVEPDLKNLICNTEIAEALEDLDRVLVEASEADILSQLQDRIAIFLDLGTVLGISEFVTIAQTTRATLEASPQAARNIGQLAKVGFQAALQALLNDNNHNSNPPSLSNGSIENWENLEIDLFSPDLDPIVFQNSIDRAKSVFLEDSQTTKTPKLPTVAVKKELQYNISKSLVWQFQNNVFILPYRKIEKNLSSKFVKFIYSDGEKYLRWQSQLLQVYQLSELLSYKYPQTAIEPSKQKKDSSILIINFRSLIIALEIRIDRIFTASELTIKPFSLALTPPNYIYGCIILANSSLACAIDVPLLLTLTFDRPQNITNSLDRVNLKNHNPTILVVDDSSAWRQTLLLALQKKGYNVLQSADGREAIEQLQNNSQIQLIISDLEMPYLNGFELLAYCRQDLLLTELPFILLTTRNSDRYRKQAKELGVTEYFTKPYNESELLDTLQSYLQS